MTAAAVGVWLLLILPELPGLWRRRQRRALVLYAALALCSLLVLLRLAKGAPPLLSLGGLGRLMESLGLSYNLWQ